MSVALTVVSESRRVVWSCRPRCAPRYLALLSAGLLLAACVAPGGPGTVTAAPDDAQAPVADAPPAVLPERSTQTPPTFGGLSDNELLSTPIGRDPRERRVAVLLPLTGPIGTVGRDLLDAAQMSLFEVADDASLVLLPFDTQGTQAGARAAARRAVSDGADLILGPLLATSVRAIAPIARANGINVVAFSNDRNVAGDGVFTMGFLPREQVERVVDYARRQGLTQFAVVAPNTVYGTAMVDALEAATFATAASFVDVAYYDAGSEELPDIVRRFARFDERRDALRTQRQQLEGRDDAISKQALSRLENRETLGDLDFEAVLLPAGGSEVLQLAPLMAFYDIDPGQVRLLGTWLWDDPALGKEPTMIGAWFAAPPPLARADFQRRFDSLFGREPDRRATLAYDAVALAVVLARQGAGPQSFTFEALTSPSGFAGTDGIFRLLPSGAAERGLAVLEIRRNGPRVLEAAPETFQVTVN